MERYISWNSIINDISSEKNNLINEYEKDIITDKVKKCNCRNITDFVYGDPPGYKPYLLYNSN